MFRAPVVEPPEAGGRDARRNEGAGIGGETIDAAGQPAAAKAWTAEAARVCLEQGCGDLSFLVAGRSSVSAARDLVLDLDAEESTRGIPVFIELPAEPFGAAVTGGSLLVDGVGDGICMQAPTDRFLPGPDGTIEWDPTGLGYAILQGCRLRLTRAEFIACPSCGRTQFDLQATTKRIQQKTAHLAGVKIAIMGCVVNGPGEMADADFGYVGSAPGKIDLYVGRTRVRQAIPQAEADRRLIDLIKEHGMWTDPRAEGD